METVLSSLSKKTKAEIIAEYERLLQRKDEAILLSKEVHEPERVQAIASAQKAFTISEVEKSTTELKVAISGKLSELSKTYVDTLDGALQQTRTRVERFSELTNAIDLSEKRLKSLHNIEITATTLETLIVEHEDKKRQFEFEQKRMIAEFDESMSIKKRDWKREEEEYEYALKTKRSREEAAHEDELKKRTEELVARENVTKATEEELALLRTRIQNLPQEIEKNVKETVQETTNRIEAVHKTAVEFLQKEWDAEKRIAELKYKNVDEQNKKLETELAFAKKELELSQKKVQELAVKVIEHRNVRAFGRENEERTGTETGK